ncbi:MAG TPA: cobalt ECF transporter T component CbiQ [Bryobacteraceae bacterium]|nr:cobalt ECF transporter T component CbiQ [Bryobacteraceae bacterium]
MNVSMPGYRRGAFVRSTALRLSSLLERGIQAEELARQPGFLQGLDPKAKIIGLLSLTASAAWTRHLMVFAFLMALALILAAASRIPLKVLAGRVWAGVLLVTGVVALPAVFLVPGDILYRLPVLHWPVTSQGISAAVFLIARVATATTFSALLIFTTPWTHVLKGLRVLRVPVVLIVILSMTYRYIVLLLQTAYEMFEARQSRMVGRMDAGQRRRMVAATAGALLSKTLFLSEEVYFAMRSRGYQGDVYVMQEFRLRPYDWLAMSALTATAAAVAWVG